MLELTLVLIPNPFSTAKAVVVPPGILSPMTRHSFGLQIDFPIIFPNSTASDTFSGDNAVDSEIFLPNSNCESK